MMSSSSNTGSYLRPITRIFWALLTLGLGVIPSFLFFAWVERNMALPETIYQHLGWPWVSFFDAPISVKIIWNLRLFFAFGFFHTFLAQNLPQTWLKKILPGQCVRAFYLCFAGASCLALMGCWQNTGLILWVAPGMKAWALFMFSALIFYGLLFQISHTMKLFDPLEFLGFTQLYSLPHEIETQSAGGELLQTGVYSFVRHPIYCFTMAAFLLTPMMSLDRLLLASASGIYLWIAIPIEERKLSARFGAAYEKYRTEVPAVIPSISRIGSFLKTM